MSIQIFTTGGTIDKCYNEIDGTLYVGDSIVEKLLQQGRCTGDFQFTVLMQKDSLDITDDDRLFILDKCQNSKYKKILITHGTDTMVDTAKLLSQYISDKTIVLTGSMIPYSCNYSDAFFNLGTAIGILQVVDNGVFIAMNGKCFNSNEVTKDKERGLFKYCL